MGHKGPLWVTSRFFDFAIMCLGVVEDRTMGNRDDLTASEQGLFLEAHRAIVLTEIADIRWSIRKRAYRRRHRLAPDREVRRRQQRLHSGPATPHGIMVIADWLTRAYAAGDVSDEQCDRVLRSLQAIRRAIGAPLPSRGPVD